MDNQRITQADQYQPLAKAALAGLKGQRVQILIDRVLVQNWHNILVISVALRPRSIPLVWKSLDHRGQSGLADQHDLLTQALALLMFRVRVSIHGDSEFRSQELFAWLRARGHDGMLGVSGRTLVATEAGSATQPLESWVRDRETVVQLNAVQLTEAQHGPVNVIAWCSRDDDRELIVRAVMTNLPATWQTYLRGKRRMWIETVFRDWQSGGFHLVSSAITDRNRFARLLLPLVIAYLWFVSLGRWVVKKGYRKLIDDGPARNWQFSLFQLGVGWKERLGSYTQPIPVLLYIYL